jgi:hypothetical protein
MPKRAATELVERAGIDVGMLAGHAGSQCHGRTHHVLLLYPAHTIIRNFFGSMTRKLSVTSSQYVGQFLGTSLRRKFSIAMLKSLNVA